MSFDPNPSARSARDMKRLLAGAGSMSPLDAGSFEIASRTWPPEQIVEVLRPYLTDARAERIEDVLKGRTYTVVPVVDGIVNTGNVSAVMRTAEGLGFQGFHAIEAATGHKRSERTACGADKWLDVRRWASPGDCAAYLRDHGYRIVVTHLEAAIPIERIDFTRKTAIVFGNEQEGVSAEMLRQADERCVVAMVGFVESFNISVAAAVALYHAYRDRLARQGYHGDLTEAERKGLRALYYLRSISSSEKILERVAEDIT